MVGIFTYNEHKWLYERLAVIGSIDLQFSLGAFVAGDAVQKHHFIELLITKIIKIDVGAGDRKRGTGIAILDSLGQRILKYHILERHLFCTLGHKRRGGQFQSEQRFQFVKSLRTFFCTIMVRFIHNKHQIRQIGKVLVERVTDDLVHLFHVRAFLIELIDIVHEDANIGFKQGDCLVTVVIIRDNLRRGTKAAKALEHILGAVIVTQVLFQFLINSGVRRNDKKVLDAVLGVQIGDKRTHQPGLANAGGQGKGQR